MLLKSIVVLTVAVVGVALMVSQLAGGTVVASPSNARDVAHQLGSLLLQAQQKDPLYWPSRRKQYFFNRTRFNLTDDNLRLLGLKGRTLTENKLAQPKPHLPYWFDYELYKFVFKKADAPSREEELERHYVYINTCVRVLKARVLFRMLAGTSDTFLTEDADKFYWEKFGPMGRDMGERESGGQTAGRGNNGIAMLANFKVKPQLNNEYEPIDRAIRLVTEEMKIVESKNQVETYLRAFNETDGSALPGSQKFTELG